MTKTESCTPPLTRAMAALGLMLSWKPLDRCPPPWRPDDPYYGNRYRVTLRKGRRSYSFDFWGSAHDREVGEEPTYYDILTCIVSDAQSPTDADEVYEEYGDMKPSQAFAVAAHAKRLRQFMDDDAITALRDAGAE